VAIIHATKIPRLEFNKVIFPSMLIDTYGAIIFKNLFIKKYFGALKMVKAQRKTTTLVEIPQSTRATMRVPVRIYSDEFLFNQMQRDETLEQGMNVACLPGIEKFAIVLPDGHQGYGFPIGGVAAFNFDKGIISPGGVGYDINCGVRLITTSLDKNKVMPVIVKLVDILFKNIPSGVGSKGKLRLNYDEFDSVLELGAKWAVEQGYGIKEDLECMEEKGCISPAIPSRVSHRAKTRGLPQLGTLGAGNHFLEIQVVDTIFDKEIGKKFGITHEGQIVVMLHCGSRGLGHQVCSDYIKTMLSAARKYGINLPDKELACAPLNSPEAKKYLEAMNCAVNYAFCNREVMTHWIRESFMKVFKEMDYKDMKLVYDVCHNIAKIEEHRVDGETKKVCVHRKGGTRAFGKGRKEIPGKYRDVGQPVIIPGDMGTASYLLVGTEKAMEETFGSTCHGAGRVMSRSKAIKRFYGNAVLRDLKKHGIYIRATHSKILAEEAPDAYKDISKVIETVHNAGLSRKIAKFRPLGVTKG
jgi:tRNA-splicing ligase RtcB